MQHTTSKGETVNVSDLNTYHLGNAILKMLAQALGLQTVINSQYIPMSGSQADFNELVNRIQFYMLEWMTRVDEYSVKNGMTKFESIDLTMRLRWAQLRKAQK